MMTFQRADRVSGLIQQVLSEVLQKKVADPRLKMTIITGVKMSRDLRHARIFFATAGGSTKKEAAASAFADAHGYLKHQLAGRLGLRYMPQLKFFYDDSFDYGSQIDQLLKSVIQDNGADHTTD